MAKRVPSGEKAPESAPPSMTALPVNIASDRIFVGSYSSYAVTSDGRFITTQPVGRTQQTIHLVTNWNGIVGR